MLCSLGNPRRFSDALDPKNGVCFVVVGLSALWCVEFSDIVSASGREAMYIGTMMAVHWENAENVITKLTRIAVPFAQGHSKYCDRNIA